MNYKEKTKYAIVVLALFLFSCKQPIKDVLIDNPSNEALELRINDNRTVEVPANGKFPIPLKFGKVSISVNNGEKIEMNLDKDKEYLLNPSLSQYYIHHIPYALSGSKYASDYGQVKSKIGNIEVQGDFTKLEPSILMEKTWLFDLDTEPSASVGIKINPKRGYKIYKKIVRERDILNQISQNFVEELGIKIKEE